MAGESGDNNRRHKVSISLESLLFQLHSVNIDSSRDSTRNISLPHLWPLFCLAWTDRPWVVVGGLMKCLKKTGKLNSELCGSFSN